MYIKSIDASEYARVSAESHIVTVIDRGFVELAGVMLKSLMLNGDIGSAKICVVCDGLRQSDKDKICEAAASKAIIFVDLSKEILSKIATLPTNSNWSRTIYARLLLPEILGAQVGKILYLDADILILKSLRPLITVDMMGLPLGAVGGIAPEVARRLEMQPDTKTMNSGVLLIDAQAWRREELSQKVLSVVREKSSLLKFFDQDALNITMSGDFLSLGHEWNNLGHGDVAQISILHFTHDKPNSVRCIHPAKELYMHYRKDTPWADKPLQSRWHKRFHRIKHSLQTKLKMILGAVKV